MSKPTSAVRLTAIAVSAAYGGALYLSGVRLEAGWKAILGYLPVIFVLLLTFWDAWLWRQPVVHRFARRPLLRGLWCASLKPTSGSNIPQGGDIGPIEAYVVITQTFWSLSVRQYTRESYSDSKAAMWASESQGTRALVYTYANAPKQEYEARSRNHLGTASLDVVGIKPLSLVGHYFTDRYTKGDMVLSLYDRTGGYTDYESVRKHCQGPTHAA